MGRLLSKSCMLTLHQNMLPPDSQPFGCVNLISSHIGGDGWWFVGSLKGIFNRKARPCFLHYSFLCIQLNAWWLSFFPVCDNAEIHVPCTFTCSTWVNAICPGTWPNGMDRCWRSPCAGGGRLATLRILRKAFLGLGLWGSEGCLKSSYILACRTATK